MKPYYVLYGVIGTAAVAAFLAFLLRWDVLFYLAIVALFYTALWALWRASTLEKESYTRFMEAETLRAQAREQSLN